MSAAAEPPSPEEALKRTPSAALPDLEARDSRISAAAAYQLTYDDYDDDDDEELSKSGNLNDADMDKEKQLAASRAADLCDWDAGLVGWDSLDDPENPKNWPQRQKTQVMIVVLVTALMVPIVSTLFAPGQSLMAEEFGLTNKVLIQFTISAYVLGFGWGPLFHAPLSELYGRKYVVAASNMFLAILNIGCSEATSVAMFLVFRALSGILGCAGLVVGAGIISDMYRKEDTGRATAMFLLGPIMGPVVGPILGGFISQRAGWRWCFRVIEFFACFMSVMYVFAVKESNPTILLRRKVERLRRELNRPELISIIDSRMPPISPSRKLALGLTRAVRLMLTSPVVMLMSLYMTIAYAYLYVFFTTLTDVLINDYGWTIELSGLGYISVGVGTLTSVLVVGGTNDKLVLYLARRNGGVRVPEMRLGPLTVGSILIPASLFWYGWGVQRHIHWFPLILSLAPMGAGLLASLIPIQAYLIELYGPFGAAASATAALNLMRSTAAALIPLAVPSLVDRLDYGWGYSLLGFIAVFVCTSMSFFFVRFGKAFRQRFPPHI
ncbi:major facilitator superfamily domain-containing protein [Limtongia smithiae]|uniref:major facilitator superfamily domain-containing protein n=1 Tax=Limtongia smithiae TaxID=1125753 RepID=UPI0034CF865D